MTDRTTLVLLLALLIPASSPRPAVGWGEEGHKIVCEIAWRRMTPEAKDLVRELRAADRQPRRGFAESCVWADKARDRTHRATEEYHYINIARGASDVDLARDCPAFDCVPVAIRRYAAYLAREDFPAEKRAEALKFLGHFVGDAHQPLHAGYEDDRGGNDIVVDWPGRSASSRDAANLHIAWDAGILRRGALTHPRSALVLDSEIAADEAAGWLDEDVESWVSESYGLAVAVAYEIPADRVLGEAYLEKALPVVKAQLKKAGVRLAFLINSIARAR